MQRSVSTAPTTCSSPLSATTARRRLGSGSPACIRTSISWRRCRSNYDPAKPEDRLDQMASSPPTRLALTAARALRNGWAGNLLAASRKRRDRCWAPCQAIWCPAARRSIGPMKVSEFFDDLYGAQERYWWHEDDRYSLDPADHPTSLLAQMALRALTGRAPGRALDIGAGEGADSIRLALLGYFVDAVEISKVGAAKIRRFAADAGVADRINVAVADIVN